MNAPSRNGFVAWLKGIESRLDAWAATQLTPDEYADAVVLDRQLKRNFWRLLAIFGGVVAFGAVLGMGIWPKLTWGRAFLFSAIACFYILAAVSSAWYGYRKYTVKPAWSVFAVFIVSCWWVPWSASASRTSRWDGRLPTSTARRRRAPSRRPC